MLAIVEYALIGDEQGGVLIDQDGWLSAVNELRGRYADRVNYPALLRTAMRQEAPKEVVDRILKIITEGNK